MSFGKEYVPKDYSKLSNLKKYYDEQISSIAQLLISNKNDVFQVKLECTRFFRAQLEDLKSLD